jgi:hypothetical protein
VFGPASHTLLRHFHVLFAPLNVLPGLVQSPLVARVAFAGFNGADETMVRRAMGSARVFDGRPARTFLRGAAAGKE